MDETLLKPSSALEDTRSEDKRKEDYKDDELASGSAVTPFQHERIKELTATVFNQWYTSSCVMHGFLTTLEYAGIITPAELKSQLLAYRKRVNYPGEGCIAVDAWDKIRSGVSPLQDAPITNGYTESMANALNLIQGDPVLKDRFNYFEITDKNKIAGYVASGKPIPVFIYATLEEWAKKYVEIIDPNLSIDKAYVRHCVVLVPNGDFTKDGIKYFTVHDSATFGGLHLRYVPLDFILNRSYYAGRIEPKAGPVEPPIPPVTDKPDMTCEIGDKGEAVLKLQRFLIKDGKLESKYLTGYYGRITADAVLWYQLFNYHKFTVDIPQLLSWKGSYWGNESIGSVPN